MDHPAALTAARPAGTLVAVGRSPRVSTATSYRVGPYSGGVGRCGISVLEGSCKEGGDTQAMSFERERRHVSPAQAVPGSTRFLRCVSVVSSMGFSGFLDGAREEE
eukprot:3777691-Rhodomonas_salina.1